MPVRGQAEGAEKRPSKLRAVAQQAWAILGGAVS